MMATSATEIPIGYTSRSNSSSGSVLLLLFWALGDTGSAREDGNQSCIPRAPYVHQGISTSADPATQHEL